MLAMSQTIVIFLLPPSLIFIFLLSLYIFLSQKSIPQLLIILIIKKYSFWSRFHAGERHPVVFSQTLWISFSFLNLEILLRFSKDRQQFALIKEQIKINSEFQCAVLDITASLTAWAVPKAADRRPTVLPTTLVLYSRVPPACADSEI